MISGYNHIIGVYMNNKQWIWTNKSYPNFYFDKNQLNSILLKVKYHQGILNGIYLTINKHDIDKLNLDILTTDALDTSEIEGQILNRDSVRSSIAKKLGIDTQNKDLSTIHTDGLTHILIDATANFHQPISLDRVFGWHNALFPTGYSDINQINVAQLRGPDEMQIVSGLLHHEKVHYIAPPRSILDEEIKNFIHWINKDDDLGILKAGIAHLWFVIIHPLDDGNGRIARALGDWVLAKEAKERKKLFSVSSAIKQDKKGYYSILEQTTSNPSLDITPWLSWFLATILKSLKQSQNKVQYILQKTAFWDHHKFTVLNARQIKVLNKHLDTGIGNFNGNMNTRKYAAITKTSKVTASRELKDLVNKGCIVQCEGTAGRNISYEVLLKP